MIRILPILVMLPLGAWPQESVSPQDAEFFEKKIRPVLADRCYKCHSQKAEKLKGGLRLDSLEAMLKGGDQGPSLVPGKPEKSRLIEAVEYGNVDLQMPPKGKLTDAQIADLTTWVKRGAPWPAEKGTADSTAGRKEIFDLARRKAEHWAWQPLRAPIPPAVKNADWVLRPLDAFILAKLEESGLSPAPRADRRTLIRRIFFDLIGLPPGSRDVEEFVAGGDLAAVVDRLLASPQFGEKWARHWLDLTRYAETRGHEYDYPIANPWPYRDYVIRALNDDLPYPRFVSEHVAGDLLPEPRMRGDVNESLLATGWWYLGEWLHSPVDTRADEMDRVANQIEVFGKTFLALTINCARCHDHKFDAISQRDYYALAGFIKSSCYRQARYNATDRDREAARELALLRSAFEKNWGGRAPAPERAAVVPRGDVVVDFATSREPLQDGFAFSLLRPGDVLPGEDPDRPTGKVVDCAGAYFDPAWSALKFAPGTDVEPGKIGWTQAGKTLRVAAFVLTHPNLYYLVRGAGAVVAEVDNHRMINGPLHGATAMTFKEEGLRWVAHRLKDYVSPEAGRPLHRVRLEFTPQSREFAVLRIVQGDQPPDEIAGGAAPLETVPLGESGKAWLEGRRAVIARLAKEASAAVAVAEAGPCDERLLIRGNPATPGEAVPRRFLEAFGGAAAPAFGDASGRLELARQLTDPAVTPVAPRVAVNRLWHHLMGRGLVPTVDDFGKMGQPPTHPELLDFLASRFVSEGGSLKKAIREIVLSNTYAMSAAADPRAREVDGANLLWHSRPPRRLPAEAIRDAMLAVSGRLDLTPYGPPVPIRLDGFQEGRGKPKDGPLDGAGRRSVYLSVRRNFLSSMLLAFDFPQPFTAMGRRSVSNVPAQSLILRNSPFVHDQASVWATRILRAPASAEDRVRGMFLEAYARPATPEEVSDATVFLQQVGGAEDHGAWKALAHVLFQAKEFILLP